MRTFITYIVLPLCYNLKIGIMIRSFFLVITVITISMLNVSAQDKYITDKLEKLWVTSDGLKTTESVLYDPIDKVIYVANINENPWEKDGNGYISRLKTNGEIIDTQWVKGLSAPKGMGLYNGKLFVTNIDEVVEIDVKSAAIINRYTHAEAANLNDIAIGADGSVYISDSKGNNIYEIANANLNVLAVSTDGPTNGLYYERGRLLCGQTNRLAVLDLKSKKMTSFIQDTGSIDGIEAIGDGSYLISDWLGHVHIIKQGKQKELILNTTSMKINAADIEFDQAERILFVPTFFHNSVSAYRLK